ncbi:hypothetical protein BLOT_009857 [Blomia tropicalis]|nr:hypothetical protein BLOT_009857 [Blomia tropicalis]
MSSILLFLHSHWQRNDYKSFPSNMDLATRDEFARAHSIQQLPIQSAICTPKDGQLIAVQWKHDPQSGTTKPFIELAGYANSGGGRAVIRVDLTTDNGRTWHMATLEQEPNKPIDIPLSVGQLHQGNTLEFACRAFDSSYNAQPKQPDEIWNFRRLLNNSWHRIKILLDIVLILGIALEGGMGIASKPELFDNYSFLRSYPKFGFVHF